MVNQMLFDGFTTKNNVASAKTQVLAARENLRNNEMNLLFSAAQAFMDVYLARQIVILRQKNLEFLDEQLRAAKARFDVGEGTRTDVAQAESEKAAAIATLNVAQSDEKTAVATYIQITGSSPDRLEAGGDGQEICRDRWIRHSASPLPIIQRYCLRSMRCDSAGYTVKANEGALLPQVDLTGDVTRNEIFSGSELSTSNTDSTTASAGIQVTIPIYSGGRTSALVRQSKETWGQRRIEVDVARDSVRQAIAQAYSEMEAAQASDRRTEIGGRCCTACPERCYRGTQGWSAHDARRVECAGRRFDGPDQPGTG